MKLPSDRTCIFLLKLNHDNWKRITILKSEKWNWIGEIINSCLTLHITVILSSTIQKRGQEYPHWTRSFDEFFFFAKILVFNYDLISGGLKIAINCSTKHWFFSVKSLTVKKVIPCITIFTIFSPPELRSDFQQNWLKKLVKWPSSMRV